MGKIVFSKTGLSNLTIEQARSFPLLEEITINQQMYLTEGNEAKVVDYGDDLEIINIVIGGLSHDNLTGTVNGLLTWFKNSAINWAQNSFTMTDETGAAQTVRFWDKKFKKVQKANGIFDISFKLKKE